LVRDEQTESVDGIICGCTTADDRTQNGSLNVAPCPQHFSERYRSNGTYDVFERFTDRARRVLVVAQEESREPGHPFIGTENILLGLIREHDGIAARALDSLVVNYEPVRARVVEIVGPSNGSSPSPPPFTERAKKVLELSLRTALQLGHSYIGTEHLLLGLVLEGNGVAVHVLVDLGIDMTSV
jgi:ATP-dependent Clp protease ATP-binding subunit ClpC